jgi:hypothetical protein
VLRAHVTLTDGFATPRLTDVDSAVHEHRFPSPSGGRQPPVADGDRRSPYGPLETRSAPHSFDVWIIGYGVVTQRQPHTRADSTSPRYAATIVPLVSAADKALVSMSFRAPARSRGRTTTRSRSVIRSFGNRP